MSSLQVMVAAGCALVLVWSQLALGSANGPDVQLDPGQTTSGQFAEIPNSVLSVLGQAESVPPATDADTAPLMIAVNLGFTDRAGFEAYLDELNQLPAGQRAFLSPTEQADRFGPSQASYDAVAAYLQSFGFTVTDRSTNRLTMTLNGTRAEAERAFHISIGDYRLGDLFFYANDANPQVPASIADSIEAITGLNNLSQPHSPIEASSNPSAPAPALIPTLSPAIAR